MSCSWKTLGSCKDGRCGVKGKINIEQMSYETCIDDPLLYNKQGSLNKVNCLVGNLFSYIDNFFDEATSNIDQFIVFWNKTNIKPCLSISEIFTLVLCNQDYVFVLSMFIYFSLVGQNKKIVTTTQKYCCQCIIPDTSDPKPYLSCVKAIDFAKLFCCLTNKCCTTSTNCCCGCSSSSDDKVQDYINDLKGTGSNYLSNLLAGFIQNAHNNQTLTYLGNALNELQFETTSDETDCSKICSHTKPNVAVWTEKNQILFIKSKPSNSFDIHPSLLCKIPIKINISKLPDKDNSANDVVQVSFKQVALVEDLNNFLNAFVNIYQA